MGQRWAQRSVMVTLEGRSLGEGREGRKGVVLNYIGGGGVLAPLKNSSKPLEFFENCTQRG